MGNGMFIITTDHAGIPDIVEDGINGILIKDISKDYDCLKNIEEDFIYNVIKNNRLTCKERFQEKKYVLKINDIYKHILID